MRVEQKADGSYQKVFTETEFLILKKLSNERKHRETEVQLLKSQIKALTTQLTALQNRVKALEAKIK